ncbi:MAG: glycoside hydrolase family 130 protein [Planctomycetota bacterium]
MTAIPVQRLRQRLRRDAGLTIARFFWPGSPQRAAAVIDRVRKLDPETASRLLDSCLDDFGERYDDLPGIFEDHCTEAVERVAATDAVSRERRQLIGAYFTMEYAYASAAFFNPSIVPAQDQSDVPAGSVRFVMSLRAVGEGHVSSLVFRTGLIDDRGGITIDPVPPQSRRLKVVEDRTFMKRRFRRKLIEAGAYSDLADVVLDRLGEAFALSDLERALENVRVTLDDEAKLAGTDDAMRWLAHSNYQVKAPEDAALSQLVLFPLSENESNGLEDMRLVTFTDDDGSARIYGTYTAYNGSRVLPQLMEIKGQRTAEMHTLSGRFAVNKGMALFPRRLRGRYAAITRHDGRNLYLATSDNIRFWNEAELIQEPRYPWEFVQIGNCGSPLETDTGWLLLTHGVGPMRRYCIGATLLDRDDPTRVIGQTSEPLLLPLPEESGGYVPNVVYTCGAMVHNGTLVIPYGISDVETGFAAVALPELLAGLRA